MNTIFPWAGGARLVAPRLLELLPKHTCFVELFAGSARLLFEKDPRISRVEVINDVDDDLVNLYEVVRNNGTFRRFIKALIWLVTSRTQYERFKRLDRMNLGCVEQALRTFYLLKVGFGGQLVSPSFGYSTKQKRGLNVEGVIRSLRDINQRLSRVYIENLDFEECVRRYDRPGTLFYCAPPYYRLRTYRHNLSERDHLRLRRVLGKIKGKFLLTYNDVPEVRKLYATYRIKRIRTRYTIGRQGAGKWRYATQLVITNY